MTLGLRFLKLLVESFDKHIDDRERQTFVANDVEREEVSNCDQD